MGKYFEELKKSMESIAEHPNSLFIGQAVSVPGTAISTTLTGIEKTKLLEMPVEEDFQMGVSLGFALQGYIPISIFPRWNFLLLATNQLINHVDKLKLMTGNKIQAKMIIRTAIGSENPIFPGPQHTGDFTEAFRNMGRNINVVRLDNHEVIVSEYKKAFERKDGVSTLLVEWVDKYHEED